MRRADRDHTASGLLQSLALTVMVAAISVSGASAQAAGCIKGAVVGGVAGHYAGHTVMGAVGGCVVGHHLAKQKAAREHEEQLRQQQQNAAVYTGGEYRPAPNDPSYNGAASPNTETSPGSNYTGGAYHR